MKPAKWKPVEWVEDPDDKGHWSFEVGVFDVQYLVWEVMHGWVWHGEGPGYDFTDFAGGPSTESEPKGYATCEEAKAEAEKHFYEQLDLLFAAWSKDKESSNGGAATGAGD